MADILSKEKRSERMSKIRSTNTKPELLVRKFLFSQGFRFRLHRKDLPGRPDIVLSKYRTAIYINGCFWHGHQSCQTWKLPVSRREYWKSKIERNRERDIFNLKKMKVSGWKVIVVWECEIKRKGETSKRLSKLIKEIMKSVNKK